MVRKSKWGILYKIDLSENLDIICDILIPAVYLKAVRKGDKELKRIEFYKKLAKKIVLNSNLSKEEKFCLIEDLKSWFNFLVEDWQVGGYYYQNEKMKSK